MKPLLIVILAIAAAVPAAAQTSGLAGNDGATMQAPWGVQIAGNYSKAQAMADFTELQRRFSAILTTRPPMISPADGWRRTGEFLPAARSGRHTRRGGRHL